MSDSTLLLKRQVTLKAIVTENFKKDLEIEFKKGIDQLENAIKNMTDFVTQTPDKKSPQLDEEINKMSSQLAVMKYKLGETATLKEGQEYLMSAIDGFSTLKKGDDIRKKLGNMQIITKDYIVEDLIVQMPGL